MPTQNINVNLSGNAASLIAAATQAANALNNLNKAATNLSTSLNNSTKAATNLGKVFGSLTSTTNSVAKGMGTIVLSMNKFAATIPINTVKAFGSAISGINSFFSEHNKALSVSNNAYKGLVGQVANLNRFINVLGSSVRQIGQGLQNFATVFSIYVSAPIAAFVVDMTKGLIDFQDKMIEVRRTTGLSTKEVTDLGKALQQYSLSTPTPVESLADQAAEWGKLGIEGKDAIEKLTISSDKLMNATDLTSAQVVDDLGKIGHFYFKSSDELAKNYDKMASAINELGQKSPVSESEIISSALRAAPIATTASISLPELLGLSTTLAERAASPERAGSQLARALEQNIANVKKFSDALGMTEDQVKSLIDANPAQFFLDILDAISKIQSVSERVSLSNALFGGTGEKAVQALEADLPGLYDNIVLANKAFADGTSIQVEYERSLDSVKTQLGILNNNFRYLGYSIAEIVLPYITKFAEIAIPLVKNLGDAFQGLDEKTKIFIASAGALVAVMGPIVLFLGSLLFSVGIITTGLTSLFAGVIEKVATIGGLGFTILSIIAPVNLLRVALLAVGAAFIYLYNVGSKAGNFFATFVNEFATWGYNLFSGFADGINASAGVVYKAVSNIIDSFVGLIQSFSPPKEGPLKDIDKWGANLTATYAAGIESNTDKAQAAGGTMVDSVKQGIWNAIRDMANNNPLHGITKVLEDGSKEIITFGDTFSSQLLNSLKGLKPDMMSLFSDTFSSVRSIIEAVGNNIGLDAPEINKRVLSGAGAVENLVKAIQGGKSATGTLQSIYGLLGGLGTQTEDLVSKQQAYNKANEDLDKIKKAQTDDGDRLRQEIETISGRTDLTLNQRSSLIRDARFRSQIRKDDLNDEKQKAQDKVDALKNSADAQSDLLKTLTSLIFPATKDKIKKDSSDISGAIADTFNPGSSLDDMKAAEDRFKGVWQGATDGALSFLDKVSKAQEVWRGFVTGLMGTLDPKDVTRLSEDFWKGFTPGDHIRKSVKAIVDQFVLLQGTIDRTTGYLRIFYDLFTSGVSTGFLGLGDEDVQRWNSVEDAIYNIGHALGAITLQVQKFLELLKDPAMKILNAFGNAGLAASDSNGNFVQNFLANLDFNAIGSGLAEGLNNILHTYFSPNSDFFNNMGTDLGMLLGGILDIIISFFNTVDLTQISVSISKIWKTILDAFDPINLDVNGLSTAVTKILQAVFDTAGSIGLDDSSGLNVFAIILKKIVTGISNTDTSGMVGEFGQIALQIVQGLADVDWTSLGIWLSAIINQLLKALGQPSLWIGLGNALGGLISGIATAIAGIQWDFVPDIFAGLITGVTTAIGKAFDNAIPLMIQTLYGELKASILTQITGGGLTNQKYTYDPATEKTTLQDSKTGKPSDNTAGLWDFILHTVTGGMLGNGDTPRISKPLGGDNVDPLNLLSSGNPGSGGQSPVGSALGGPIDEKTTKSATSTGQQIGTAIAQSVQDTLTATKTVSDTSIAVGTLTDQTAAQSKPVATDLGTNLGTATMQGYADRVTSTDSYKQLDTSVVGTLQDWTKDRTSAIQNIGDDIGSIVVKGLSLNLDNTDVYMLKWINVLKAWVSVKTNIQGWNDVGFIMGNEILNGALKSLVAGQSLLQSVAGNVQSGLHIDPSYIDSETNKLLKEHFSTPSVQSASIDSVGVASVSGVQPINITITGGVPQDRKAMEAMANMLYDKMRKEGALRMGGR